MRSPAISRNRDVLPEPLRPVTAMSSPVDASKLRPENTSRPPRTQFRPLAKSRILPLREPSKSLGVGQQNSLVRSCRRMIVAVAVTLESFYKPELNAAHNHRCKPPGQPRLKVLYYPKTGYDYNWDCL